MTIACGDAPMIESALLVSIGATALVIEMIERGEGFPSLRVRDPIAAMRQVSRGGPFERVRDLGGLTAIDVQRAYLARAKEYFAGRPAGSPERMVLDLWARLLGVLADRPDLARDAIDWCAKKALLDAAVLPESSWKAFAAWGGILESIERSARLGWEDQGIETVLSGLPRRTGSRVREMLRDRGLDPRDYARFREIYLHARKIEFRYHEISREGGYHDMLEEGAEVRRLTGKEEIEYALRTPPRGTRAWARGALVKASRSSVDLEVRWDRVLAEHGSVVIPLADPFSEAIPPTRRRNRFAPGG